jgi:hypothetical protein
LSAAIFAAGAGGVACACAWTAAMVITVIPANRIFVISRASFD